MEPDLAGMKSNYMTPNSTRSKHSRKNMNPSSLKLILSSAILIITVLIAAYMLLACGGKDQCMLSVSELAPSISNYQVFTPLHLFFLLNLLIVSILLMTHLHKDVPPAAPCRQTPASSTSTTTASHRYSLMAASSSLHRHELHQSFGHGVDHSEDLQAPQSASDQDELIKHESRDFALDPNSMRSDYEQQYKREQDSILINPAQPKTPQHLNNEQFSADPANETLDPFDGYTYDNMQISDEQVYNKAGTDHKQIAEEIMEYANHGCSYIGEAGDGDGDGDCAIELHPANPKVIKEVMIECRGIEATAAGSAEIINEQKISDMLSRQWSSTLVYQERPLASTHFTHKRHLNRAHASKSPLKISRPSGRKGDTLDATWKAICQEKSKHSMDTCEASTDNGGNKESHVGLPCLSPSKQRRLIANSSSSTSGFIRRRELSIPRDELNARVESFISKFHQQIRIQREQSLLNHKKKMVHRGAK